MRFALYVQTRPEVGGPWLSVRVGSLGGHEVMLLRRDCVMVGDVMATENLVVVFDLTR
jgi:hypothetical protein